jgi:hypothetical protein
MDAFQGILSRIFLEFLVVEISMDSVIKSTDISDVTLLTSETS